MSRFQPIALAIVLCFVASPLRADPIFLEAEAFTPSSHGWTVAPGPETRQASGLKTLHGSDGPGDGTASHTLSLAQPGHYRVWVRFRQHPTLRGPFDVTVT